MGDFLKNSVFTGGVHVGCFISTCNTSPVCYTQRTALRALVGEMVPIDLWGSSFYHIHPGKGGEEAGGVIFHRERSLGADTLVTITDDPEQMEKLVWRINEELARIFETDPGFDYEAKNYGVEKPVPLAEKGIYKPASFIPKTDLDEMETDFMKFCQTVGWVFHDSTQRYTILQLMRAASKYCR